MKRVIGITFSDSEIKGSKVMNGFVYDTNIRGETDPYSVQEHVRWLIKRGYGKPICTTSGGTEKTS